MNIGKIINTLDFEQYGEAVVLTMTAIFAACDICKCTKIGIGYRDDTFKDSKDWPDAFGMTDSLFADGRTGKRVVNYLEKLGYTESNTFWEDDPKVWAITNIVEEQLKDLIEKQHKKVDKVYKCRSSYFCGGCGNFGQHQCNPNNLILGIYEKINGTWIKTKEAKI